MQTKMSHLQEAAELESAIAKLDEKHDAAKKKLAEKHAQKLLALAEKRDDDERAVRGIYSDEACELYDKMQSQKGAE